MAEHRPEVIPGGAGATPTGAEEGRRRAEPAREEPRASGGRARGRKLPLRARLALAWNRILSSTRFQRAAAAFPLTRPVALKRTSDVFDLCAGFVYTQTLSACLELGLLGQLKDDALTTEELRDRLDLPPEVVPGLLEAAASVGLLKGLASGHWVLGRHGAALVGNRELAAVIRHNRLLYQDLAHPVEVLEGADTTLSRYWPYAASEAPKVLSGDQVAPYSTFMAASQPLVSAEVLAHDPFDGVSRILDIGGGEGAFLEAVGRRYPSCDLHLFDLPAVADRARERFGRLGWSERARAHGGDFLRDALPEVQPDVVTLVRVLHDLDDDDAHRLLEKIRSFLPDGGHLLIAEPMSGVRGAPRVGDAYFFWYLRALGRGRARTPEEIDRMARAAGFARTSRPSSRNPVIAVSIRAIP